ncbi:type II secretion system protein GspL [Hephaestia mangrovi]|uniref:type II secretion system protein GspL n=1 Tax=Hephaestia mangrovi TaxID=2873268 RepID=UPI001CA6CC37|nr:general secretion pathway protein GspL [Hephaestia mangrovi]
MSETIVLFPPQDGDEPYRWLRIAGDAVVARGEGVPALPGPEDEPQRIVSVAPADAVTLHWAELPDRSVAQAVAAARIALSEASAASMADLHVAVGREDEAEERPIGVVGVERMRAWLGALAAQGIDPDAVVPAPMLLPRPEVGYVRADLAGHGVVRGATAGFADEARLTELVTGGTPPETLDRDAVDAAIVAAATAPALDLRQGPFAKRRRRAIDWALVKRLGWLAAAIVVVTVSISVFRIIRTEIAAEGIETRTAMVAEQGLPAGTSISDPERQLAARLAGMRGAGLGFSSTAGAVFGAVQAIPGTELTALTFDDTGALKITVTAQGEAAANDLKHRIESLGFTVDASTFTSNAGQVSGDLTVKP